MKNDYLKIEAEQLILYYKNIKGFNDYQIRYLINELILYYISDDHVLRKDLEELFSNKKR